MTRSHQEVKTLFDFLGYLFSFLFLSKLTSGDPEKHKSIKLNVKRIIYLAQTVERHPCIIETNRMAAIKDRILKS